MRSRVVAVLALLVIAAALALALRPHESTAAEHVDRITSELRCPVCQGLSVKDSPSETAREMRDLVVQRVNEGKTDAQIEDEFRAAYGDWVILAPPLVSWNGVIWAVPILALVGGVLVALRRMRTAPPALERPNAAQLAALRERVRAEEAADV
jgi:cytochrome c-type biogenesis protein CcmH